MKGKYITNPTVDGRNPKQPPVNYGIFTISTGYIAGFLEPSEGMTNWWVLTSFAPRPDHQMQGLQNQWRTLDVALGRWNHPGTRPGPPNGGGK